MLPWDMLFSCNIYLYAWNVATKDICIISSFLNRDTKFPAYIFMHHILIVSILWLEKNKLCLLGMEVPLNLLTGESLTVMGNVMNTGVKDLYEAISPSASVSQQYSTLVLVLNMISIDVIYTL